MKKLTVLTALLTLSVGLWAETVNYIDANGQSQTANATVITNSTTTLKAGWYVVTGTYVQTGSLTCNGEVHLILADGALLRATGGNFQAGIQVSGEGNSLSIYGQTAQSGKLEATGGIYAAGIGGGYSGSGSNITINGGDVTATGGEYAAGIGGGYSGSGSNITINGGTVMARGEDGAAGIGGGRSSSGSDIFMPVNYRIKAGGTFIHNDGTDLASSLAGKSLAGKQNVEAYPDGLLNERDTAFAAISAAVEGFSDEAILAVAAAAMEAVFQAERSGDIEASKQKALSDLQYVISLYNSGYARGKAAAFGSLGTKQNGPAVIVTDQDGKEIILYSPKNVKFTKVSDSE